jgi:hypothetical protein
LFEEVSGPAGLNFNHQTGATGHKWFPESYSGGVAVLDFDDDGDLDVYCVQAGRLPHERDPGVSTSALPGNVLYENLGDGTFRDVTARAGVGDPSYGIGVACGDYDGDGRVDIYVLNLGPNVLYRNNGDGTFTDVSAESGAADPGNAIAAAFFDYDADGHQDLFVANYILWTPELNEARPCTDRWGQRDFCSPTVFDAPAPDTLLHNNGDGAFTDVSKPAGIHAVYGNGMGVVAADFNGDGRLDLYVSNDGVPNQLWINNGDGTFHDEALLAGCAVNREGKPEASMGIAVDDLDDDGDPDLFMTHLHGETHTFYRNDAGLFDDQTLQVGLNVSNPYTGFGTAWFDYDHDGRLDLFVAHGRVSRWENRPPERNAYAEPDMLLHQSASGVFEDVSATAGPYFQTEHTGRGAAFGDLDNDGDLDIVVVNADGPARWLRNTCITPDRPAGDASRHWLMVKTRLRPHGGDAIGAKVSIVTGDRTRTRDLRIAYSYASSNDPRVHFGLGAATAVDDLIVRWPDGEIEHFGPQPADHVVTVRRGEGTGG